MADRLQLDFFKKDFTKYLTKMKDDGYVKGHHVRKMKAHLKLIVDLSKGMGKDTGTDTEKFQTELRSSSDESSDEDRSKDDLPITEQEWIKFMKLVSHVFQYHIARIPYALQNSSVYVLSKVVDVPSYIRERWNIDV